MWVNEGHTTLKVKEDDLLWQLDELTDNVVERIIITDSSSKDKECNEEGESSMVGIQHLQDAE
jgi:hypothetical protein